MINGDVRFFCSAVPKTAPTAASSRQPQLDLMSELQQTDSSFPITGLTNTTTSSSANGDNGGNCSTSDQVSEIAMDVCMTNEVADYEDYGTTATSSSRNTVLTSTSTIKPANSCVSLTSPMSPNNEAGKWYSIGIGVFSERNPPTSEWHDGQRRDNVLCKIQPSKRCYELAFVFSCA